MSKLKIVIILTLAFTLTSCLIANAEPVKIKYRVDENFPPYAYWKNDELAGFDLELAGMIFSEGPYEVEYSSGALNEVLKSLVEGEIDASGIVTCREDHHDGDYLHTDIIKKVYLDIFIRSDGPDIKKQDLKNCKIGVVRGSYAEDILKTKIKTTYYYTYKGMEDALLDLDEGRLDGVIGNHETVNYIVINKMFKNKILPGITNLYSIDLKIGVNKNNPELLSFLNDRLKVLKENGSFELLHQKYFSSYTLEYYEKQKKDLISLIFFILLLIIIVAVSIIAFLRFYIKRLEKNIVLKNKEMMLQKTYFNQLFENSPQATVIIDLDDNILNTNASFERVFGYNAEETVGKKLSSLILPLGKENEGSNVNDFILESQMYQKDVKRRRKDGTIIDLALIGLPIIHEGQKVGVYGIYTDISEKKIEEEMIKHRAYHDSLTKLPNRAYFMDQAEQKLAAAKDRGEITAMLFIDLDRFKNVNDTYGHDFGDKLLIEVGSRLNNLIRKNDFLARIAGDEFLAMLNNLESCEVALNIAERIHKALGNTFFIDDKELNITASFGIAFYPDDGMDAGTLLKNSDIAMYAAKEKGRNNFQIYSKAMKEDLPESINLTNLKADKQDFYN